MLHMFIIFPVASMMQSSFFLLSFSPGINDTRFVLPLQLACWYCTDCLLFVCFSCHLHFLAHCAVEPTQVLFSCLTQYSFFISATLVPLLPDARFIVVFCCLHLLFLSDQLLQASLFCFCHCCPSASNYCSLSPHVFVICKLLWILPFHIFPGWHFPGWPMQGSLLSFCHWCNCLFLLLLFLLAPSLANFT